jgi:hypothetical protein
MNDTEIDRILSDDPAIYPSPAFTARVMRAVRSQPGSAVAGGYSASHLWPAWAIAAVLAVVSVIAAGEVQAFTATLPGIGTDLAAWLSLTIPGTLAMAWWSTGLFGSR